MSKSLYIMFFIHVYNILTCLIYKITRSITFMDILKFKDTLRTLRTNANMTQAELGQKLGQATPESAQARIAKLESKKSGVKPNINEISIIADTFNVSIDYLLGRSKNEVHDTPLSPRSICALISKLSTIKRYNMLMTTIEVEEEFWSFGCEDTYSTDHHKQLNNYNAIYFSNWFPLPEYDNEEYGILAQTGSDCPTSFKINKFLKRLNQIKKMKAEGNLDEEMYHRLLQSYLDDVPDK